MEEKFENVTQTENDLDERLQVFYTKLEREEFYDVNDFVNDGGYN